LANTLTGLIPTIYEGLDVVSRELIGFIPAVSRDTKAEQAAKDATVRSPIVPAMTAADITPAATSSSGTDRSLEYVDVSITKSRKVSFHLTGEQELSLRENNSTIARDSFAQAFRTLANEVESDLADLYVSASRAYGTAGTAPFATAADFTDLSNIHQILDVNGAPRTGRQMVLGTAAMVNLRGKQSSLFKANEAGTDELLRNGIVARVMGFDIHDSAEVVSHTKGTGASYLVNSSPTEAVGSTSIQVDGGSGTVLAGDIVTFAGTAHKYVVGTALSGGTLVLNKPGLLTAEANNDAMTVGNSYTANMAFTRDAIVLAARTPAVPSAGDNADDRMIVTDPVSGISFEIAVYRQYRQVSYEVGLAWGVKAVKSAHMAILLG
jgi:hypothetical protein